MEWGNTERIVAIQVALDTMPHYQTSVGMGFKLIHDPARCNRCRASIALLELSSIIRAEVPTQELSEVS